MTKSDSADQGYLCIGDFVLLVDVARMLNLSVEGILREDLQSTEEMNLQDSLFCVHLQRQYSASRDLNAFLEIYNSSNGTGFDEESARNYILALEKGRENEKKLNDNYMKKKNGQSVEYGGIIQLYHVKSGKYLTVVPGQLAKEERENTRLTLDPNGNAFSWIQVVPRYKINKEGDRILSNSEVYLKVAERSNEYIHSAERNPLPDHNREVNCALESTSWRLSIFQSSKDALNKKILLASQLITINDPETHSNITIAHDKEISMNVNDHTTITMDDDEAAEYFHDYGDITLEPAADIVDSNFLWFIESESTTSGGPITWKNDRVRFQHLNTGLYLLMVCTEKEDEKEEIFLTKTDDPELEGTLFGISEINSTREYLGNSTALQICQNNIFLERGEVLEGRSVFSFPVKGTREKSQAVSLIAHRYSENAESETEGDEEDEDEVVVEAGDASNEPLDVHTGVSARKYLRKYFKMTVIPRNDMINTVWPSAVGDEYAFFENFIDKTIFFSQGFPISSANIKLGIDKADNNLRTMRQNLLREQNTLEVVLQIIHKLIPMTEKFDKMKSNSSNRKKRPSTEEELAAMNMAQHILGKSFELLRYCILDNPDNQMYVADCMTVLLAHLNSQPLAGKCVTEMLSKNMELQETKIGTQEIQIFVDKLRSSKMNDMYLQLLQSCCSCEGQGVDGNQCKVANMLFSNTNDIIIQLHANYGSLLPANWNQKNSLYLLEKPVAGSPINGDSLISKGLPALSLAWTTNSIDYSPLGLFGKLSVNVEELFRVKVQSDDKMVVSAGGSGGKLLKSKKKSSAEQKQAVANYFIAEIFLGAEMCMDRNYIAMHKLEELFSYEVLITLIKLNIDTKLKSAAARLLMCLYIDRDPNATSKIPCLTRTWSDIKKHPTPQLPYVDAGRRYYFGLVQQMVSDHIHHMAGTRWDDLSKHMLRLLKTMVEFNFYGTNERMEDVIGPLLAALDRRKMVEQENVGDKTEKKKKKKKEIAPPPPSDNDDGSITGISMKQLNGHDDSTMVEEKEMSADYTMDTNDYSYCSNEAKRSTMGNCCMRLLNVLTLNTAAQILSLDDENGAGKSAYKAPPRYSKAEMFELETMVEAVDILAFAQRVIEDRNVSLLLRSFFSWETGGTKSTPAELFEQAIVDSKKLTLGIADFDNIMVDLLLYVHTPLVQSTLEVLMAHHSKRRSLLDHAKDVQLLASHKRERQFKIVDQMLQQLEQNAERQELWGELETEADYQTSAQTKSILLELTDICRVQRQTLEFEEVFTADAEIQNLYRNLGCFDICMKVMDLLDSIEEDDDGEIGETGENTREICKLCNDLLLWFFWDNFKNQELGFGELTRWLDTLDEEINSHTVIKAIFKGNESLMRQMPHAHLKTMTDKIVKDGKSHHYLTLFVSIPNVGEKNIVENQFEIVKSLTAPGRLQKVSSFLVPITHPDYAEKREMMAEFLDKDEALAYDDLPPLLAYHLLFLDVLSGCTVGRMNVTAVEAKVQSVFSYADIVESILDPGTILVAKVCMGKYLFNAIIEVELLIPGLDTAACIWRLIETYAEELSGGASYLSKVEANGGLYAPGVNRQRMEYILVSIMNISGFFSAYYEPSAFKDEIAIASKGSSKNSKVSKTRSEINELIGSLYTSIRDIEVLDCSFFDKNQKTLIKEACEVLQKSAPKTISDVPLSAVKPTKAAAGRWQMAMNKVKDENELKLINKYNNFVQLIEEDRLVQYNADNENVAFITLMEKLPFIADPVDSDVRYENLIRKLVFHIKENVKVVNNQKRMDPRVVITARWIIKAFRTMIENRMGMSIYERDDDGGEAEDNKAAPVVNALNNCGATALCLDLIAFGIDEQLQLEAIKLGVGLLFKEGGAAKVQGIMNNHLVKTNSELFFKQVRQTLQKLQAWHTWNEIIILEDGDEPDPPPEILILRFLQLMCEGHYLPNQDIMREQPTNPLSFNLLDDFVNYFNCLSRLPCRTSTSAGIRLTATILEILQGPCAGNQMHFAMNTELVETLNRVNRAKAINDCEFEEEIELKKNVIDISQGMLEGQGDKSVVYDRVLSVIHLDIISSMSKNTAAMVSTVTTTEEASEECLVLQTECVVLLQMLCNFKPSLYDELGISRNIEDIVGSGTACIEVIWRGDIHRRFFHVPAICDYLAKSSKDFVVADIDRSNAENKLIDFLKRSHDMYLEVKHQQLLTKNHLSVIFSRESQNRATFVTFFLSVVINALFLANFHLDDNMVPTVSTLINVITTYLNGVQTLVALFTLVLWLVVRTPVNYQSFINSGQSSSVAIINTASDPMTMYYISYLIVSLLGLFYAPYFVSLLMLDIIVKDQTTQAVLMAIVTPRKALAMGFLLQFFVVYIYSFYIFWFFHLDIEGFCETLWDCLKATLSLGLQNGGGIGDAFDHSTDVRLILDFSFFAIVLIILLNVIMGMIIDTFSSLRAEKNKKDVDTEEVCFICNIGKQVFDRASDEPDGFKTHVKIDHNMWNYLYFIFMLWEQDKDDDDGLEQFVRLAIDDNDISWFPTNKAIRLETSTTPSELLRINLKESIKVSEEEIGGKLDDFRTDINGIFTQLMDSLKFDARIQSADGEVLESEALLFLEDDESSVLTTDSTVIFDGDENTGFHIDMSIINIEGPDITVTEENVIFCQIVVGTVIKSAKSLPVEGRGNISFKFDENNLHPLLENINPSDTRPVSIQVMEGSADSAGGLATGLVSTRKFIGAIEFSLSEIMACSEQAIMSKRVEMRAGGDATIRICVKNEKASAFGRLEKKVE